jgi:hypothetical protein
LCSKKIKIKFKEEVEKRHEKLSKILDYTMVGSLLVVSLKSIIKFIHGWGSKKKNNDSKIVLGLVFTNNIYKEQI